MDLKSFIVLYNGKFIRVYKENEADKVIADLEESHKMEVEQLLMEIVNLKDKLRHYPMMVALLESDKKEIAELKEAQRWRKYSEEKPRSDGYYIICGSSGFRNADRFMECKDGRGMDFSFYSSRVRYWMPLPPAPKEVNK